MDEALQFMEDAETMPIALTIEPLRTVQWISGGVRLIDQTVLPERLCYVDLSNSRDVAEAIRNMIVRGAPAIGCTAALGMALGAREIAADSRETFLPAMHAIAEMFRKTRPTAVNLFWAIERILGIAELAAGPVSDIKGRMLAEALAMLEEDVDTNRRLGRHGAELLPDSCTVLTHCNAGALATVGHGTALGVVRTAVESGKRVHVYADETRPRLQGMKLTAWELVRDGIPVTVIADNMAASLMRQGDVDCVIVGADRIAANGDTANKIGTYGLAIVARHHRVPFYVAAPFSTIDFALSSGEQIPIEHRDSSEMMHLEGARVLPIGANVLNPAFDVTPADLITAIVTESGVLEPPYQETLRRDPSPTVQPTGVA